MNPFAQIPFASLLLLVLANVASSQEVPPYRAMDYGPFLTATVEVAPGNIAQKGLCVRLDPGPGGVAQGRAFLAFDTDTLRYAAGWSGGGFIDWHGIIFDGAHGAHPKIVGSRSFANPSAPGVGHPTTGTFDDPRLRGLDGKAYGPLPRSWAAWKGVHLRGDKVILAYEVGGQMILERPSFMSDGADVFIRNLELSPHNEPRIVQVIHEEGALTSFVDQKTLADTSDDTHASRAMAVMTPPALAEGAASLDFGGRDFTLSAWIKTAKGIGTIVSKAPLEGEWAPKGKCFFIRDGRVGYDVGWVGAVQGKRPLDDDHWHHVAVTYRAANGRTRLFVDGKPDGEGDLRSEDAEDHVVRIGYTATTFMPPFTGAIDEVRVVRRALNRGEIARLMGGDLVADLEASYDFDEGRGQSVKNSVGPNFVATLRGVRFTEDGHRNAALLLDGTGEVRVGGHAAPGKVNKSPDQDEVVVAALVTGDVDDGVSWVHDGADLRLRLTGSETTRRLRLHLWRGPRRDLARLLPATIAGGPPENLGALLAVTPPSDPEAALSTTVKPLVTDGPFAVDELTVPTMERAHSWLRLGGFDFFDDGDRAAVCSWQGDVWLVEGLSQLDLGGTAITWRRIAQGLFQPLGLKIRDGAIHVLGRDQITRLVDLNGDGVTDFYENFNNDAQVTEHFHEFAMDLQADAAGNFYYMKGARHAKTAVIPQHGTLIRVSPDGTTSTILAGGFRAPNGLTVNDDGTFLTSDQEGHWTPMNRINWLRPGGFYGNMMAYAEGREDDRYDPPLCWIHKNTDRSPAAQVWVTNPQWRELDGALLSLSYGTGRVWNVLHEWVGDQVQGGIVELPLPEFPTGIQRGRFHPRDGQLYLAGLFGWSSNKTRPGGFFRVRRTAAPLDLPISLNVIPSGVVLGFSSPLDATTASDPRRFKVERWNYRRTRNYGSADWRVSDGKEGRDLVQVQGVKLSQDGRALFLQLPDMGPCMQMEIHYTLRTADGRELAQKVHHTIHALGDPSKLDRFVFDGGLSPVASAPAIPTMELARGLEVRFAARSDPTTVADVRVARWAALRIEKGAPASPFVDAGPFEAVFSGFLDVDLADTYTFTADAIGHVRVRIDGVTVLDGQGKGSQSTKIDGQSIELLAGIVPIEITLTSNDDGSAALRTFWSGRSFAAEPIPSRALRHPENAVLDAHRLKDKGRTLFAQRGCVRCHEPSRADRTPLAFAMPELKRDAPSLQNPGSRLDPAWMTEWMLDPRDVERHAAMPRLFNDRSAASRQQAADIALWLASLNNEQLSDQPVLGSSREEGARLYEDLGCIACHTFESPEVTDRHDRHSLYFTGRKFRPGALRAYLLAPHAHHAFSAMPDFRLRDNDAASLALFLRDAAKAPPLLIAEFETADAARGATAFRDVGCGHCHAANDQDPLPAARPLAFGASSRNGCLADAPASDVPQFALSGPERSALKAFLATDGSSLSRSTPWVAAERAVQELNCQACHDRDDSLSPRIAILLAEGRKAHAPDRLPALTSAGAKLNADWVYQLLSGTLTYRARPWLAAAMPSFPARSHVLAAGLAAQHGLSWDDLSRPAPSATLAAIGATLTRTGSGFSCIQCHGVGDLDAFGPFGDRGVNFTHVSERLRYDFYGRWMRAPERSDPQTKMPKFSADGRTTVMQGVLEGRADRQFDALWHYLATRPRSPRALVRRWTFDELVPSLKNLESGRSFSKGEDLFQSMACTQCHQMKGHGGKIGPDLTAVGAKHSPLAMLRELVEPSAVIEDRYRHHVIFTKDDAILSGLLASEDNQVIRLLEDALDPTAVTTIPQGEIAERRISEVSPMPTGLLDTLTESEILDLMAYLRSGGDPTHKAFSAGK